MNGYNLIWLPYLAGCISFRVQNGVCLFNCAENYSTLQLKEHAKKPNHFTCTSITIKIFPFIHESRQKKLETVQFFFVCNRTADNFKKHIPLPIWFMTWIYCNDCLRRKKYPIFLWLMLVVFFLLPVIIIIIK